MPPGELAWGWVEAFYFNPCSNSLSFRPFFLFTPCSSIPSFYSEHGPGTSVAVLKKNSSLSLLSSPFIFHSFFFYIAYTILALRHREFTIHHDRKWTRPVATKMELCHPSIMYHLHGLVFLYEGVYENLHPAWIWTRRLWVTWSPLLRLYKKVPSY